MGMNAHMALGGDLLIATVDGIVPISARSPRTRRARAGGITADQDDVARRGQRQAAGRGRCELGRVRRHLRDLAGGAGQSLLCRRQRRDRRVVRAIVGWDAMCFMPAARRYVLRHAGRNHHAGRPHRLRRRQCLCRDAGRRLGDVSVSDADGGLASGAGLVPGGAARAVPAADHRLHRLRRHHPDAARPRSRPRRARCLGSGSVGRGAVGL
jgi:hypothetical protein